MALTKVSGGILQQPINVGIVTATSIDATSIDATSINVSIASTIGNTVVGGATTELVVGGDSLVTGNSFISGISSVSNTTESTTKDTGAVVVEGGVGIEKRLNVGGPISAEESAIVMNPNSISRDTTIPENYNAQTIGPDISVSNGVDITVSAGSNWTIT